MEIQEIYDSLVVELKKFYDWCRSPDNEKLIEIDTWFLKNLKDYDINIQYGKLKEIYMLLDYLYDSISHGQNLISEDYSTNQGIKDLSTIIKLIDNKDYTLLENQNEIWNRIKRV